MQESALTIDKCLNVDPPKDQMDINKTINGKSILLFTL